MRYQGRGGVALHKLITFISDRLAAGMGRITEDLRLKLCCSNGYFGKFMTYAIHDSFHELSCPLSIQEQSSKRQAKFSGNNHR